MPGGAIAGIVVGVIIFLLCIPIDLTLRLDVHGKPEFKFKIAWLFGRISWQPGKQKKEKKPEPEPAPEQKGKRAGFFFEFIRHIGLIPKIIHLVRDIVKSTRIREFEVDFKIGLGDPADTAILCGAIGAGTAIISPHLPYRIRVEPSFDDEPILEGHFYLALRWWPILIVIPLMRFFFSSAGVKLLKLLVFRRWRKKN